MIPTERNDQRQTKSQIYRMDQWVPCQFRAPCCDKAAQREETVRLLISDVAITLTQHSPLYFLRTGKLCALFMIH